MPLVRGNSKLGKNIWHWSIPANELICRMASLLCSLACYAKRGHYHSPSVRQSLENNYQASLRPGFVTYIVEQIQKNLVWVCRIHASGELYSARYIRSWISILHRCARTLFFGYTRSWREPDLLPAVTDLASRPNMRLWLSCDRETGEPPQIPFTRRAYMQVDHDDIPAFPVDLVFRVKTDIVAKKVAGILVCPAENGITKITCDQCGLCFRAQHHLDRINNFTPSESLQLPAHS